MPPAATVPLDRGQRQPTGIGPIGGTAIRAGDDAQSGTPQRRSQPDAIGQAKIAR